MVVKLSVNINKVALIRNSRGENLPNLIKFAQDCESYGADGITVHPRPDERHIRYEDVKMLKKVVQTELNVEGYPSEDFMRLIAEVKPHQCTLVPDPPHVLTSNEGWKINANFDFLRAIIRELQTSGIRSSLFLDPDIEQVEAAKEVGVDRIELYTGSFARHFESGDLSLIEDHQKAAKRASQLNIGVNAGHDLNLKNLAFYSQGITNLSEVSIGHALISDALYYGISNTISMYKQKLNG